MKTYKNLSGTSGVVAYEIGKTFIKIKFEGESGIYTFDYKRPGKQLVEEMKTIAVKGLGLSTFISEKVAPIFHQKNNMKKLAGGFLIVLGVIIILVSIMALVKTFDVFTTLGTSTENIIYTLGSIIFPLLLTVFGRWVFRKGFAFWRQ